MNKQDFINRLRAALNGSVSPNVVAENVNFYNNYIDTEIYSGKNEEEVLRMLGDPRLIAKTIIATNSPSGQGSYQEAGGSDSVYSAGDYRSENYGNEAYRETDQDYRQAQYVRSSNNLRVSRIPGWLWTIISILLMVAIISVVLSVLSFLAPVIITILVVLFLVKLFRDWLN